MMAEILAKSAMLDVLPHTLPTHAASMGFNVCGMIAGLALSRGIMPAFDPVHPCIARVDPVHQAAAGQES